MKIRVNEISFGSSVLHNHKLQLHDAIYRLRFYSKSLIHILSLSNSHNNVASIQKNRGDKSHRVIVAILRVYSTGCYDKCLKKGEHQKLFLGTIYGALY